MTRIYFTFAVIALLFHSSQVFAQEKGYISLGIGQYDVFDRHSEVDNNQATDFRLEYRPNRNIWYENVKPWFGLEFTSDRSIWLGGGLLYDYAVTDHLYVTPMFAVGAYAQGDSDIDLDYPLQFKEQLELSYEFDSKYRLGAAISHLSNAGIGDSNPGVEIATIYWHAPLSAISDIEF